MRAVRRSWGKAIHQSVSRYHLKFFYFKAFEAASLELSNSWMFIYFNSQVLEEDVEKINNDSVEEDYFSASIGVSLKAEYKTWTAAQCK